MSGHDAHSLTSMIIRPCLWTEQFFQAVSTLIMRLRAFCDMPQRRPQGQREVTPVWSPNERHCSQEAGPTLLRSPQQRASTCVLSCRHCTRLRLSRGSPPHTPHCSVLRWHTRFKTEPAHANSDQKRSVRLFKII